VVKSVWTYNLEPERNYCKFLEVARLGFRMRVYIYKNKTELYDIWSFVPGNPVKFSSTRGLNIEDCKSKLQVTDIDMDEDDWNAILGENTKLSVMDTGDNIEDSDFLVVDELDEDEEK
jgi:hypothetical protein